jgi:hypothetical protein
VAAAQSAIDGAIGGSVFDQQKAVVPGARVVARNIETNQESAATSDAEGRFRVLHLQPAIYSVTITARGFSIYKRERVVVEIGSVTTVEAILAVAGVNDVVEVTDDAPTVQTEQHDFTSNVNQTDVDELPINGRRWSDFALLTPGATPDGDFGLVSFRGIAGLLNNNTVDGGDNNQAFFSEERGRTRIAYAISQSAIREFQVNVSNYSSEYGRAAGAVVNAITKSGTNSVHGDIFYYMRDNAWGAMNPYTTQYLPVPGGGWQLIHIKPEDRRQQFGADLGGALVKDKLFYFFSYDQQTRNFPGVAAFNDPNFLGGSDPNNPGVQFLRGLTGMVPRTGDQTIVLPKLDYQIGATNRVSATYNRLRWNSPAGVQTQPVVHRGVASFGNDHAKVDTATVRATSGIGATLSNELRYQYSRDFEFEMPQAPSPGEPTTGPGGSVPDVYIGSGGIEFGKPTWLTRYAFPLEKRTQLADTLTWSRGRHLFKFGTDFNHVSDLQSNLRYESGSYEYSNLADFLLDYANPANRAYSTYTQGFGPTEFQFSTNDINAFVQDDFHAMRKLTLNLGVRYEYEMLPTPKFANPLLPQSYTFPADANNLGPRLGFAYDLLGDGRTALLGGYGIYYGRIINAQILNAFANTGSPDAQLTYELRASDLRAPLYPNTLAAPPSGLSSTPDVFFFQRNFQAPLILEADVVLEREVARNTVVRASWLYSKGTDLPIYVDTNLNPPTRTINYVVSGGPYDGLSFSTPLFTGARPNASFGRITQITSSVVSRYNALVLEANRRWTDGLQFRASYTWSHALDDGQSANAFAAGNNVLNAFNQALERSDSTFDVRQRVVARVVWAPRLQRYSFNRFLRALLSYWSVAPVFQAATGRPWANTTSGNAAAIGGYLPSAPRYGVSYFWPTTTSGVNGSGGTSRPFWLSRNVFRFPGTWNVDARLSRRIYIGEEKHLEFLVEAFNIFNHVNATDVNRTMYVITVPQVGANAGVPTLTYVSDFGTFTAAGNSLYRERQIQLGARFHF